MTHFMTWMPADDADFRTGYEAATGESVELYPPLHADGSRYLLGTSRADEAECAAIAAAFAGRVAWGPSPEALGWEWPVEG